MSIFNQDGTDKDLKFYLPAKKTKVDYLKRINERWAKVSFRVKSMFKFISLLAVVGLVTLKCQYV